MVETADDILAELDLATEHEPETISLAMVDTVGKPAARQPIAVAPSPPPQSMSAAASGPHEKSILATLRQDGSFVDEIAQSCRLSVAEALSALTMLELKGLVRQFSGKRFAPR